VNEANGIRHEVFEQLSIRTKVATFLDYNADAEFWVHHLYAAEAKASGNFCRSTYLDNPFLSPAVVASIEAKRGNSEWWRVYGEGRTGKSEGVIYKRAEAWHQFPDDVRRFGYGLDFGFSEPLALVKCGIAGEHIYAQEIAYQSGLTPSALAAALPSWGVAKASPIWADGARPEIIMEMRRMGYNVRAAVKGPESVVNGIMALNDYSMRLMGPNLTKEARMYKWATHAATGQFTRVPAPSDDHALDALRYWGIMNLGARAVTAKIISL
jgi:phage terminase large subunit